MGGRGGGSKGEIKGGGETQGRYIDNGGGKQMEGKGLKQKRNEELE